MGHTLLASHPEGATGRPSRVHPGHPNPILWWGFKSENAIRARLGGPRAKARFGQRLRMARGHWEKLRSRAIYESIRKTPTGEMRQILVASSPSIPFFPWVPTNGPFWPFFGPRGVWGRSKNANLAATRKLLMEMGPTQLDY